MDETPDFASYSYEELLDVYQHINEEKYPENKAKVDQLLQERKDTNGAEPELNHHGERSRYSTFGPRVGAATIDCLLLGAFSHLLDTITTWLPLPLAQGLGYVSLFQFYIYSILLHGLYGQTLGKWLLSIKVLDHSTEGAISFRQAFLRDCVPVSIVVFILASVLLIPVGTNGEIPENLNYLLIVAGAFNLIWFLIEVITMLSNSKRRALHDYIAGTVVVNTDSEENHKEVPQ